MEIGKTIFYNNKIGDVIYSTGDISGDVVETPHERIISIFNSENQTEPQDISVMQLDFVSNRDKIPVRVDLDTLDITWQDILPNNFLNTNI